MARQLGAPIFGWERTHIPGAFIRCLCIRLGYKLPGTQTIPAQIATDKSPYYGALEAADQAYENERIDVSALETLLGDKLVEQLVRVHQDATAPLSDG